LRAALVLGALFAFAPSVSAQSGCTQAEHNVQCTEFGTISMESQRDIRGSFIDQSVAINLNTAYADQQSRWLLFSVRNVEADGSNPVTIEVTRFASAYGDIVTTRVEQPSPSEVNMWVDTLDTPVDTPITIDLRVGSTERGAFKLETLVMAFDRGYAPIQDSSGQDASLFSFTLLGVNEETASSGGDAHNSILDGNKTPGLGFAGMMAVLAAAVAVAVLARRRA
jgi:hypothetical protein